MSRADGHTEKRTRAQIKAAVERELTQHTTVIADSLNYIKGFRYELFCLAKAQATPTCCVWVDFPLDTALSWNRTRRTKALGAATAALAEAESSAGGAATSDEDGADEGNGTEEAADGGAVEAAARRAGAVSFSDRAVKELSARFEPPNASSRWDSPLFRIGSVDEMESPFSESFSGVEGETRAPRVAVSSFTPATGVGSVKSGTSSFAPAGGSFVPAGGSFAPAGGSSFAPSSSSFVAAGGAAGGAGSQGGATASSTASGDASREGTDTVGGAKGAVSAGADATDDVTGDRTAVAGGDGIPAQLSEAIKAFDFSQVVSALFDRTVKPNAATVAQRLADTNYLHELDSITKAVTEQLVTAVPTCVAGDVVRVAHVGRPIVLVRKPTVAELRRLRRQFLKIAKAHPPPDASAIGRTFVGYIETSLSSPAGRLDDM